MEQVQIKLPDRSVKLLGKGATVADLAASISMSLKKSAVGGKVNDVLVDLDTPLKENASVQIITLDSPEGLHLLRHSTAHLMAQALKRIYGADQVSLGVGPVTADGFYYDIDLPVTLSPADLPAIERTMLQIMQENLVIRRQTLPRAEAVRLFERIGDPLKLELIRDLPEDAVISVYHQGEFTDLCRGPHLPSTGFIKAFKLLSVAGAYWRGDASNKMLQRIYGTAFPNVQQLEEHLHLLEEAKKRDHRKLGKELELFMFSEEAPGMPFYLPKGALLRSELESYERRLQQARGYQEVRTPLLMNRQLWERSGHYDHYRDNMYFSEVDGVAYALKPMNCPGHMLIYGNKLRSYRDLPIRMAENGQVHRHELSGALNGMLRVRTFTQDDTHIFCRPDQIEAEIVGIIELIREMYATFGFSYNMELSTRPDDSMGSDELWEQAENALKSVLESLNIPYRLNEGDGAFYGPKIDFHIQDSLKRSWQCATIQLDFQFPEKFDLTYVNESNQKLRPVVIHRAVYGSIDRFIGMITEHYGGAFPLWLAPTQAIVLPIAAAHVAYAKQVESELQAAGIRVELDDRSEKIGYKIREAQLQKIPYMLIIGDQEMQSGSVSVRSRSAGDLGTLSLASLKERLRTEMADKASK
ncbi:threonine--tRNA ligase [Paenibacillus allorhizosphaerae]|uniref:Threonine--tRNA ligase n=1 Tax=Paenibacillus allorhizosphaerae TaxID=2849866 RepID=A0ABN7TE39_9BACL|nr:threonine--tRNA ligase [Paenibacillus allorhizosphaerae]CAG7622132.1 Threonine--tRNA ligase 2 [Paenibacillus allorhizosphaerae]